MSNTTSEVSRTDRQTDRGAGRQRDWRIPTDIVAGARLQLFFHMIRLVARFNGRAGRRLRVATVVLDGDCVTNHTTTHISSSYQVKYCLPGLTAFYYVNYSNSWDCRLCCNHCTVNFVVHLVKTRLLELSLVFLSCSFFNYYYYCLLFVISTICGE